MADVDRDWRKRSFDAVAKQYDAARPTYPAAVFDDLLSLSRIPAAGRILEMGCGPGIATLPLAQRGFRITCVELGENLAALARQRLAGFPLVEIVNAEFETWDPGDALFDAIVAFSSFHWLDSATRYELCASRLREGGALAVVQNRPVRREGRDRFWIEIQEDYDAAVPHPDNAPSPLPEEVGDLADEIAASGLFRPAEIRRHLWDVTYTADEYVAVIGTYSPNLALTPEVRDDLFARIRRRIDAEPGGRVTKTYLATLNVALRP